MTFILYFIKFSDIYAILSADSVFSLYINHNFAGKHNPAMGAANSHPAASELNFEGETSRFKCGVRCMQGRHQKMEDTVSNCAVLYKIIRMIVFVFWQIGKDSL